MSDLSGTPSPRRLTERGAMAWMVHNRVTPNILMLVLLVGGFLMASTIKQEVFPEFELDYVNVTVAYPGASPEEVEQGIVLVVEEAVRGLDNVKELTSTAREGSGTVTIELIEGSDRQAAFQDVQAEVSRITTFPDDAERPQVKLSQRRHEVLDLQLYGDAPEWALRDLAESVRDQLLQDPGITQVELVGARDYEIQVEVSQAALRAHGLTLDGIARTIAANATEVPAGSIETGSGDLLLRFDERKDWARQFAEVPVVSTAGGVALRLGDVARVIDGFAESNRLAAYNGSRSIGLEVYRIGEETPIGISDTVHRLLPGIEETLPPGVELAIQNDRSEIYRQRLELLMTNACIGLALVLLLLGLFLEARLAFWVTLGIPTSFLGAFLFLPAMDVSINMISMFAFIIALGIVVDDAIVAGENIYEYRQRGMGLIPAAIRGARDVAMPVSFAILTNIVAFLPLLFVEGWIGRVWSVIPLVVGSVFLISWVEALFILPSHLGHSRPPREGSLHARQQAFARLFSRAIERGYQPFVKAAVKRRYLTAAIGFAFLAVVVSYALSGRMGLILMPKVESDRATAEAVLPLGVPLAEAVAVRDRLTAAAREVAADEGGERLVRGISSVIRDNDVDVRIELTPPGVRPISTGRVSTLWREKVGQIAGLQSLRFESDRGGPGRGPGLTVELSHRDTAVLDRASADLAAALEEFAPVRDVDDGLASGKPQFDFRLKAEGRALGLTSSDVARQLRAAFHGIEALKQQRGRNEVTVLVRLPEAERASEYDIEQLLIRTPGGRDVPLAGIAEVERGRAYADISRRDGRRTVEVSANVVPQDQVGRILETLNLEVLPRLARDYPGLTFGYEGRQAQLRGALDSLKRGFAAALVIIYVLLAIPFRSYVQPIVVMLAIPFGIVGAVIGHLVMGYALSLISMMGIVALAGVVVNDSLVMVDQANRLRGEGAAPGTAIIRAAVRRFRPIFLTTVTTFGGLAPMIFETSRQARFMIPMAISLGYGIVFATAITLILVPCFYLMIEDAIALTTALRRRLAAPGGAEEPGLEPPVDQAAE